MQINNKPGMCTGLATIQLRRKQSAVKPLLLNGPGKVYHSNWHFKLNINFLTSLTWVLNRCSLITRVQAQCITGAF